MDNGESNKLESKRDRPSDHVCESEECDMARVAADTKGIPSYKHACQEGIAPRKSGTGELLPEACKETYGHAGDEPDGHAKEDEKSKYGHAKNEKDEHGHVKEATDGMQRTNTKYGHAKNEQDPDPDSSGTARCQTAAA